MASSKVLVLCPLSGRNPGQAVAEADRTPLDFYYGALALRDDGTQVAFCDNRRDPRGAIAKLRLAGERLRNRLANFGLSRQRVQALAPAIADTDMAVSFTDFFSLSLGRHRDVLLGDAKLVGGFHGLSDLVDAAAPLYRETALRETRRAIEGLDHLFFFGEADRIEASRRYRIPAGKTSLFRFGVDTDFWTPRPGDGDESDEEDVVLAVGSDNKRDYGTLLAAPIETRLRIVTRLPITPPAGRNGVEIIRGSYHETAVSNLVLRSFYRRAGIVVTPIRDVFQPSGYSVTLQAMACGKPVVLSRIKGLWDPDIFVSEENCILVEPGNPEALADAVALLRRDAVLRGRIAGAARETAVAQFGLERMNRSFRELVNRVNTKP